MRRADVYLSIDRDKPLREQPERGHNRWHPDIPPIVEVEPGQVVAMETLGSMDAPVDWETTAEDVRRSDGRLVHPLSGPVYIAGAEPGDMLEVTVVEVAPEPFGYTLQIPGLGFLHDVFCEPHIVHWKLADGFATSPDLPGVRIRGAPFMGVMGVAPSQALLDRVAARESALLRRGGMVNLPNADGAVPRDPAIACSGMGTIAAHENGGNLDIKQLTRGATLRLPVYVPGALFSAGDAHFAQGDGEACITAIEMGGALYASFALRKGEAERRGIRDAQFYRSGGPGAEAEPQRYFATTGQSYSRDGVNYSEDVTVATRNALLNMIDYLVDEYDYTPQQAYAICSVAVDLKISALVNVPNVLVSAFLPLDIFVL